MHIATCTYNRVHHRRAKSSLALIFLLTSIPLIGMLLTPALALAAGVPGGNISNPVVRAVDVAKPAVVRIITTLGGHITVQFSATRTATFPLNGDSYKLPLSGSGAFISPHGDILTADHVVAPPHDQMLDAYLEELASQDIADYINQTTGQVPPYTSTDVLGALQAGLFRATTRYDQPSSEVYFSTDFTGPLTANDLHAIPTGLHAPVDKIEQQSTPDQKDVAIIHVNLNNTPSIQLGDSTSVEQQDELTIIGFPGNGDVSEKQIPTTVLTSSVNKVYVSSLKTTDAGAPVIQVGGNIEQGDSGGPALDSKGNVVGIVSFGKTATNGGPMGTSFLQASSSAQELISALKLDTTPGPLQRAWSQAFSDYSSTAPNHWQQAQDEFQQIKKSYPQFQAVAPYLAYATAQAHQQPTTQPTQQPAAPGNLTPFIIGGIILVLAIAIGLTLFLVMQNRRKSTYPPTGMATPPSLPDFSLQPPATSAPASAPAHAQSTSPFYAAMSQQQAQSPFALAQPERREPSFPPAQPERREPSFPIGQLERREPSFPPAQPERRESSPMPAMSQPFASFFPQSNPMPAVRQPGPQGQREQLPYPPLPPLSSPMPAVQPPTPSPRPAPSAWGTNGAYNYPPFPTEPPYPTRPNNPSPSDEETTLTYPGSQQPPSYRRRLVSPESTPPPDNGTPRRP